MILHLIHTRPHLQHYIIIKVSLSQHIILVNPERCCILLSHIFHLQSLELFIPAATFQGSKRVFQPDGVCVCSLKIVLPYCQFFCLIHHVQHSWIQAQEYIRSMVDKMQCQGKGLPDSKVEREEYAHYSVYLKRFTASLGSIRVPICVSLNSIKKGY